MPDNNLHELEAPLGYSRIGFTCMFCGETQQVEIGTSSIIINICDQCKKDLKEIILEKRNKKV